MTHGAYAGNLEGAVQGSLASCAGEAIGAKVWPAVARERGGSAAKACEGAGQAQKQGSMGTTREEPIKSAITL